MNRWIEKQKENTWIDEKIVLPIYLYLSMLLKEQPYFRLTMGKTKHFLNADRQTEI